MFNYEDQIVRYFKEKEELEQIAEWTRKDAEIAISKSLGKKVTIEKGAEF